MGDCGRWSRKGLLLKLMDRRRSSSPTSAGRFPVDTDDVPPKRIGTRSLLRSALALAAAAAAVGKGGSPAVGTAGRRRTRVMEPCRGGGTGVAVSGSVLVNAVCGEGLRKGEGERLSTRAPSAVRVSAAWLPLRGTWAMTFGKGRNAACESMLRHGQPGDARLAYRRGTQGRGQGPGVPSQAAGL